VKLSAKQAQYLLAVLKDTLDMRGFPFGGYTSEQRLAIYNRTANKAQRLASMLTLRFPDVEVVVSPAPSPTDTELVVNASTLGRNPEDEPPLELRYLQKHMRVADVVMSATPTPLIQAARARGCSTQTGQAMLEGQLPLIATFLGLSP